jgi:hypothetical protein
VRLRAHYRLGPVTRDGSRGDDQEEIDLTTLLRLPAAGRFHAPPDLGFATQGTRPRRTCFASVASTFSTWGPWRRSARMIRLGGYPVLSTTWICHPQESNLIWTYSPGGESC